MSLELIAIGVVVAVLNVLDSVTTRLCFKMYPDPTFKGEGNPSMRFLMRKNKWLAEVVKQGCVLGIVIWLIIEKDMEALRLCGLCFALVVANNSWVVVSRKITKRETMTPFRRLQKLLHIPDDFMYLVILAVIVGIAYAINVIVW